MKEITRIRDLIELLSKCDWDKEIRVGDKEIQGFSRSSKKDFIEIILK